MRIVISFILTIMISGCVGISNIKSVKKEDMTQLYSTKGYMSYFGDNNYTSSEVISLWGEPDKVFIKNNSEYWIYNREVAVRGILIWVIIIPIPLIIPNGYRTTTLVFNKETVSKVIYEDTRLPTASCGLLNLYFNQSICGVMD